MSKVTVNIGKAEQEDLCPSRMPVNTPKVLANKKTQEKSVVIRLGNGSFVYFGDAGLDISYTTASSRGTEWVDKHYVVCVGVKATVTLEVD